MEQIKQLTREQAIKIAEDGCWKDWTDEQIVRLQLYQEYLCVDFSRFHEAIEHVLGRGVWTHEFAYPELLRKEYEGTRETPTMQEIIDLFPKDKTIIQIKLD